MILVGAFILVAAASGAVGYLYRRRVDENASSLDLAAPWLRRQCRAGARRIEGVLLEVLDEKGGGESLERALRSSKIDKRHVFRDAIRAALEDVFGVRLDGPGSGR